MAPESPERATTTERLHYGSRAPGMDHGRYAWSNLFDRPPVAWPANAKIALWIVVSAEWFEFDEEKYPVRPIGTPIVEYPDLWGYTLLDYGNRAGMRRVMDVLAARSLRVTLACNSAVCTRYPSMVARAIDLEWELAGHGTTSSRLIHDQMPVEEERRLIDESLTTLRNISDHPIRGWFSPSLSESRRTPDLLAEKGIEYIGDWVNDDLPYEFHTDSGPIVALPYSYEINDLHVLKEFEQTAAEFRDSIVTQFEVLLEEANDYGGRCMCVALHPWLIGAPHRIRYLSEALDQISSRPEVWSATGSEILDAFLTQTGGAKDAATSDG